MNSIGKIFSRMGAYRYPLLIVGRISYPPLQCQVGNLTYEFTEWDRLPITVHQ